MRIGRRRRGSAIRTAVLVTACLAFVAMTSGLLLMAHLGAFARHADHDSHQCSLCQQLLLGAKKFTIAPAPVLIHAVEAHPINCRPVAGILPTHRPETARPRGPPSIPRSQSV